MASFRYTFWVDIYHEDKRLCYKFCTVVQTKASLDRFWIPHGCILFGLETLLTEIDKTKTVESKRIMIDIPKQKEIKQN
jgi:hypothetical protein